MTSPPRIIPTSSSTTENGLSPSHLNVGTKLIRGNQVSCFLAFFLISWIIGTISLLVTNRRRDEVLIVLILVFFATQGIGALYAGARMDMQGRRSAFNFAYTLLVVGLIGVVCSSYSLLGIGVPSRPVSTSVLATSFSLSSTIHDPIIIDSSSTTQPTPGIPIGVPYWILLLGISITGTAIGCFYPIIGVVLVESVQPKLRVVNVASMFCMQGLGHLLARCAAAIVFHYKRHALIIQVFYILFTIALLFSIPLAITAYYFIQETSVFLISKGIHRHSSIQSDSPLSASLLGQEQQPSTTVSCKKYATMVRRLARPLCWDIIGTSLPWFLFDCTFYGDGVFHFLLIKRIKGFDSDSQENNFAIIVLLVSFIGYILAAVLVTKIIPKLFQILGFVVLAFVFFGLALSLYSINHATDIGNHHSISEFLGASLMYDCFFRFFNFIPNLTTFLIPLDAFPTKVRGFFVGFAVFSSRVGAVTGMILNWTLFEPFVSRASMLLLCAVFAVLGAAITRASTPHVVPPEEDLLKLDIIYLTRIYPASRHRSGDLAASSKLADDDTPTITHQLST